MKYVSVALVIVLCSDLLHSDSVPFDNWSLRKHKISLGRGNDHHTDAFDINANYYEPTTTASPEEEPSLDEDYYQEESDDYHDRLGHLELQKDSFGKLCFVSWLCVT